MAKKRNFVLDQGSEFEYPFDIEELDAGITTLVGYTGLAQFRKHYTSSVAYDFEVDLSGNTITISMASGDSADVEPGRYLYDVELTNTAANTYHRVVEGTVTVTGNITRAANN